jgi:hypothetical protein
MTQHDVAHRLFEFFDEHAFRPVLAVSPERYPPSRRDELWAVQEATRRERGRFESRRSAAEVYRAYHEELAAPDAAGLHRRLRALDLPTLEDVRIDFEHMAADLGIGASGAP